MIIGDKQVQLGIMFRREHTPEQLPRFARSAEDAGYDELWVVEDCFYGSGIASAATALAVTDSIVVGLGIMPAVVRNPVFAAMEVATLARLYPGRFLPGFGHGVASWMQQVGAFPESQLKALEETVSTLKRLLNRERVSFDGGHVHVHDAELVFPPPRVPPISVGVRGEKSLQLSGRVADGTILSEFASPAYVRWALGQIARGQAETNRTKPQRLTVFVMAYFDEDDAKAYASAKAHVGSTLYYDDLNAQVLPMGILPQVIEMRARKALEDEIPDAWVRQLAIVGNAEACREAVLRYVDAGVDSIVLVPPPEQSLEMPDEISRRLINFLK